MRTTLVAASALAVALVGQAAAADLPVGPAYRPAPVLIGYNWNGFYAGGNVGWSHAQSNVSWSPSIFGTATTNRLTSNSVTGGAQTGYNWQTGNFLAGVEADVNFMRNSASFLAAPVAGLGTSVSQQAQMNWLTTVRARAGYAWDNWLFYATGGWAYSKVTFTDTAVLGATIGPSQISSNRSGWTAGAGVEYGIAGGWSAKLEYLYVNLGSVAGVLGPNAFVTTNHDLTDQIVRVGINYRFGGEREVVVKYP
jgi:outer membrane immunogenic protein